MLRKKYWTLTFNLEMATSLKPLKNVFYSAKHYFLKGLNKLVLKYDK